SRGGRRWVVELGVADRGERQVAEGATTVPALEARLVEHPLRPGVRIDAVERLEPRDPGEAVTLFAAVLGVEEVVGERLRVALAEAERAEAVDRIVRQERTGSDLTIEPPSSATTSAAIARSASADDDSGAATSSGSPASPHSRRSGSSGTRPSSGTPSSSASLSPPPSPNTSPVMFSTTPIRRIPVFCAIAPAREATSCAAACGVVT